MTHSVFARSIVGGDPIGPPIGSQVSLQGSPPRRERGRRLFLASRDDEILPFLCECADDFWVDQVPDATRFREIENDGACVIAPGHRAGQVIPVDD